MKTAREETHTNIPQTTHLTTSQNTEKTKAKKDSLIVLRKVYHKKTQGKRTFFRRDPFQTEKQKKNNIKQAARAPKVWCSNSPTVQSFLPTGRSFLFFKSREPMELRRG